MYTFPSLQSFISPQTKEQKPNFVQVNLISATQSRWWFLAFSEIRTFHINRFHHPSTHDRKLLDRYLVTYSMHVYIILRFTCTWKTAAHVCLKQVRPMSTVSSNNILCPAVTTSSSMAVLSLEEAQPTPAHSPCILLLLSLVFFSSRSTRLALA